MTEAFHCIKYEKNIIGATFQSVISTKQFSHSRASDSRSAAHNIPQYNPKFYLGIRRLYPESNESNLHSCSLFA
jgi:hypothetical protein